MIKFDFTVTMDVQKAISFPDGFNGYKTDTKNWYLFQMDFMFSESSNKHRYFYYFFRSICQGHSRNRSENLQDTQNISKEEHHWSCVQRIPEFQSTSGKWHWQLQPCDHSVGLQLQEQGWPSRKGSPGKICDWSIRDYSLEPDATMPAFPNRSVAYAAHAQTMRWTIICFRCCQLRKNKPLNRTAALMRGFLEHKKSSCSSICSSQTRRTWQMRIDCALSGWEEVNMASVSIQPHEEMSL